MPSDESTVFHKQEETPTVLENATVIDRSTLAVPMELTPGVILGRRYRIVSLIGHGGMGAVYRADDLKLGQTVALKFLAGQGEAQRLYEEVRIGRQISHPNVCRLYDIAELDRHLFITMEFVDGENLASLLLRVGRLSPDKALAVSRDICAGVAAAHEKGVIHRDLKPANVMIDSRGRARVTDFGLAVAGASTPDSSGTPAYMAPEQLSGVGATSRSDIYAVGLMIYELYTGRRPFEDAGNVRELLGRQQRAEFARPSLVSREIPPAIEHLIARCLEADPEARPASVTDILREIPGGDPLSAAVAAGETPSPEMVAAASKTGDLPVPIAWTLFAIALAGLFASATLSEKTLLRNAVAMKAPDVMLDRAQDVVALAGIRGRPVDSALFTKSEPGSDRLTVVYRQSPRPLQPFNGNGIVTTFDPPLDVAKDANARVEGMANVELTDRGDLLRFVTVPPAMEPPRAPGDVNWQPFIAAAGYDARLLTPTPSQWTARVDSDRKSAWLTKDGKRIEAASYHGRPVSFDVLTKDFIRYETTAPTAPKQLAERAAFVMFVFFLMAIPASALVLARNNLRRRQGDRQGALRTALFFGVVMLVSFTFRAHHTRHFVEEWTATSWHIAQASFWALVTGMLYIAVEPFVRKRWPQILISWTRLLAGRFTDAMVGRDVLLGAGAAAITIIVWHATLLVAGTSTFFTDPANLGPARLVAATVTGILMEAMLRAVGVVIVLVLLRGLVRNDIAASVLTILLVATVTLNDTMGPPWLRILYAIPATVAGVALARQFGLLAVMSYGFFVLVQQHVPLTLDADAWYFGRSVAVIVLLAALVVYGFRVAVGHRRWLPGFSFD